MFGGGSQHFRGQSTEASSMQLGILTNTQPAIGKEQSHLNRHGDANESTFFYNSDEDREVEEIL